MDEVTMMLEFCDRRARIRDDREQVLRELVEEVQRVPLYGVGPEARRGLIVRRSVLSFIGFVLS